MKIIYKQPEKEQGCSLSRFDVHNCCFKSLLLEADRGSITKKIHHHACFEMHIVTEGLQEYEVGGISYKIEAGSFLLIYPGVDHCVLSSLPHTGKYSVTFNKSAEADRLCLFGECSERMRDNLDFIREEASVKKEISPTLTENCILEILVHTFRLAGIREAEGVRGKDENLVVALAERYIEDNIEMAPGVGDVAAYCYLSTKQLTRIFKRYANSSPGEYIIKKRIRKIEALLSDQSLSLARISEIMHFGSEYYFNAFFKKHYGMPPGEYRKMLGQ